MAGQMLADKLPCRPHLIGPAVEYPQTAALPSRRQAARGEAGHDRVLAIAPSGWLAGS